MDTKPYQQQQFTILTTVNLQTSDLGRKTAKRYLRNTVSRNFTGGSLLLRTFNANCYNRCLFSSPTLLLTFIHSCKCICMLCFMHVMRTCHTLRRVTPTDMSHPHIRVELSWIIWWISTGFQLCQCSNMWYWITAKPCSLDQSHYITKTMCGFFVQYVSMVCVFI